MRIILLVVLSLGALGFNGVLYVIAGEIAGAARAGQAVALMSTALFGGGAIAAVPLGALADAEGYRSLWIATAIAAGLGVLATLRLAALASRRARRRRPTRGPETTAPLCCFPWLRRFGLDRSSSSPSTRSQRVGVASRATRASSCSSTARCPGDRVMARIQKVKRRHGEAIAFERLAGGPDRVEAPCPHFGVCGGCRWQDLRYERQLEHKQQQVLDALQRIAGLPDPPLEQIVPAVREYAYRNKLEYAWTSTRRGRLHSASTRPAAGRRSSRSRSAC